MTFFDDYWRPLVTLRNGRGVVERSGIATHWRDGEGSGPVTGPTGFSTSAGWIKLQNDVLSEGQIVTLAT